MKRKPAERCHFYRFWKKSIIFSKTTSISPKNQKKWSFWDFSIKLKIWHAFHLKNANYSASENFHSLFRKKTISNSKIPKILNVMSNSKIWDGLQKNLRTILFSKVFKWFFWKKVSMLRVFENLQVLFEKTIYFSKKLKFWLFEKFRAVGFLVRLPDEMSHVYYFWKLASIFLNIPSFSSKKNQISNVLRFLNH